MAGRGIFGSNGGRRAKGSAVSREEIAQVAYELFLGRGCEHGHDLEDWLKAEQMVRSQRRAGLAEARTVI